MMWYSSTQMDCKICSRRIKIHLESAILSCYSQWCFTFPAARFLQQLPTCIINVSWCRESKSLKEKKTPESRIINLRWFLLDPLRRTIGVCLESILNHYKESHLKAMCTYVLIHTSLMQSCCSLSWSCFGLFRVSKAESLLQCKEIVIANDVQQRQRQMMQHTHSLSFRTIPWRAIKSHHSLVTHQKPLAHTGLFHFLLRQRSSQIHNTETFWFLGYLEQTS